MTRQDLINLVAQGEGLHLEFKYRVPTPQRLAKEVTAFANTGGGYLLIGVGDDGSLSGLKDVEEEEYALHETLRIYIQPPVEVQLQRVRISRKREIIVVMVSVSAVRPHYVVDSASNRRTVFIRIKDMSVEASRESRKLMYNSGEGQEIWFEFREKERKLLRYLEQYERITVRQFSKLARIPKPSASRTLVRLTRADLLQHHPDLEDDYFTYGKALMEKTGGDQRRPRRSVALRL